jgi:plasmid maintenance system antidote protein VapI
MEDLRLSTEEQALQDTLERFRKFVQRAEASVDYWLGLPIVEFTEDICRLMDEQNVSRAELARRLGTSRAYITKLLGGNANFTLQTMVKVAMALGAAVHVHVADKNKVTRWRDRPPSSPSKEGSSKRSSSVPAAPTVRRKSSKTDRRD